MKRLALAAILFLAFVTPSWAGVGEGLEAYKRGDYTTAVQEFRKAAEQGNARAQYNLGLMYQDGYGVVEDDAEAVKWFRKAAEQGDADGQYFLGSKYSVGEGVTQDKTEATKWYHKAAEQGNGYAQHSLGFNYEFGHGVPQDYVMAHVWYNLSEARLGASPIFVAYNRDTIAKKMTPAQIAEAQRLAREWMEKHGE